MAQIKATFIADSESVQQKLKLKKHFITMVDGSTT